MGTSELCEPEEPFDRKASQEQWELWEDGEKVRISEIYVTLLNICNIEMAGNQPPL